MRIFGSEEVSFTIAVVENECEDDDFKEIMENAVFNDDNLKAIVSVAVQSVVSDGDDFASSSGLMCPEDDDEFSNICKKITEAVPVWSTASHSSMWRKRSCSVFCYLKIKKSEKD